MDFAGRALTVHAYDADHTTWFYDGVQAHLDEVMAEGYFSPAADRVTVRDTIILSVAEGVTMVWVETVAADSVVVRRML